MHMCCKYQNQFISAEVFQTIVKRWQKISKVESAQSLTVHDGVQHLGIHEQWRFIAKRRVTTGSLCQSVFDVRFLKRNLAWTYLQASYFQGRAITSRPSTAEELCLVMLPKLRTKNTNKIKGPRKRTSSNALLIMRLMI